MPCVSRVTFRERSSTRKSNIIASIYASARRHDPEEQVFVIDATRLGGRPIADGELVGHDPCAASQLTLQLRLEALVDRAREVQRDHRCGRDVRREQIAFDEGDLTV